MRNVSKILFIVGEVMSFAAMLSYLINGIFLLFASGGSNTFSLAMGIAFLIIAFIDLINAVMCAVGRRKLTTSICIANLVFGLVSTVEFNFAAAIFGLIVLAREKRRRH